MNHSKKWFALASALILGLIAPTAPLYAESPKIAGTIAYALTGLRWATYLDPQSPVSCPEGTNEGPREQFKALYSGEGSPRSVIDTQLKREIEYWFPTTAPDAFEFREAGGPIADGLNLDGKEGPNDFAGADGERGIDNQLYRALGCINSYRDSHGTNDELNGLEIIKESYNRFLIEVTGITSLENSDHVEVTTYRGLDRLQTDAGGRDILPGGTQRIDVRWGQRFIQHLHGRITNGVLLTEPTDLTFPWAVFEVATDEYLHAARLRLKLTPTRAEGLIGGYADIETWYLQLMKSQSTHDQSYGQLTSKSLYKAMRRLADAYPDPNTGANTAISSALRAQFTQVYILPASKTPLVTAGELRRATPYAGPPYRRSAAEESKTSEDTALSR
jgi:hypothetical protein